MAVQAHTLSPLFSLRLASSAGQEMLLLRVHLFRVSMFVGRERREDESEEVTGGTFPFVHWRDHFTHIHLVVPVSSSSPTLFLSSSSSSSLPTSSQLRPYIKTGSALRSNITSTADTLRDITTSPSVSKFFSITQKSVGKYEVDHRTGTGCCRHRPASSKLFGFVNLDLAPK